MNEYRLTPHNFDTGGLRNTLRFQHGFEHKDLERAKSIVVDAIAHVEQKEKTNRGMSADHLDTAMKFLNKDHGGWKKLPEHQKTHIEAALREHFGIVESNEEAV